MIGNRLNTLETKIPFVAPEATVTAQITSLGNAIPEMGLASAYLRGRTTNGYDANTKLLMYFEGTDASTTFTDQTGKTVTPSGNAQIDTAQKRWGTSSGLFDGTGDYLTVMDANNDLDLGTGDFTIECWVRFNTISGQNIIDFRTANPSVTPTIMLDNTTGKILYYVNGATKITGTTSPVVGVWYHIAASKNSGYTKLFINGVQEGLTYTDTNDYIPVTTIKIGAAYNDSGVINGWMDELRISNSARYTATFIPQGLNLLSSDKMRVTSIGKNLFDSELELGSISTVDGSLSSSTTKVRGKNKINLNANTQYIIKNHTATTQTYIVHYDKVGNFISVENTITNNPHTFTTPTNLGYSKIRIESATILQSVQIERGSVATSYESFKSTSAIVPVVLNSVSDTIYDKYDTLTGKHTKNVKILPITTLTGVSDGTNVTRAYLGALTDNVPWVDNGTSVNVYGANNAILQRTLSSTFDDVANIGKYYIMANQYIYFIVALGTSKGDAETALAGTSIYYQLATPVVTKYPSNVLTAYPSGTLLVESAVFDKGTYTTLFTPTEVATRPIGNLVSVNKVTPSTGVITPIALSTCTVAALGASFTSTALTALDYVEVVYNTIGISSVPSLTYSTAINLAAGEKTLANQTENLDVKLEEALNQVKYLLGVTKDMFQEQADVAVTINAISATETTYLSLSTALINYIVRDVRIKAADPGANTITVRLYQLVNDVLVVTDTFAITTANYTTYFSLMDMFGIPNVVGGNIKITVQTDAGTYAITGQYAHAKTM